MVVIIEIVMVLMVMIAVVIEMMIKDDSEMP